MRLGNYVEELDKYQVIQQIGEDAFFIKFLIETKPNISQEKKYFLAKNLKIPIIKKNEQAQFLNLINFIIEEKHPSIIKLLGFNLFTVDGQPFPTSISEYYHSTLCGRLWEETNGKHHPLWTSTKKFICIFGIAMIIKYFHSKNIFLNGIDPANIYLDEHFYPKIDALNYSLHLPSNVLNNLDCEKEERNDFEKNSSTDQGHNDISSFAFITYHILKKEDSNFIEEISINESINVNGITNEYHLALLGKCVDTESTPIEKIEKIIGFLLEHKNDDLFFNDLNYAEINEYVMNILEFMNDKIDFYSPIALYYIAMSYLNGIGVPKDMGKFRKYLVLAADKGYNEAMLKYGLVLLDEQNLSGVEYLRKSSELGNVVAMYHYGSQLLLKNDPNMIMTGVSYIKKSAESFVIDAIISYANLLYEGTRIPQNKREAAYYYKIASELNNPQAMLIYGRMLYIGDGITQNIPEALKLWKKCADTGNMKGILSYGLGLLNSSKESDIQEGEKYLEICADSGDLDTIVLYASELFSGAIIPENRAKAAKYYKIAADLGHARSAAKFGQMLYYGDVIQKNIPEAIKYFKLSAEGDDSLGMFYYGRYLFFDKSASQDISLGVQYLHKAAEKGEVYASCLYGYALFIGQGIPKDIPQSLRYLKIAVDAGINIAMYDYALVLLQNENISENVQEILKLLKICADNGEDYGISLYGKLCYKGEPFPINYAEAEKYLKMGADRGDTQGLLDYGYFLMENSPYRNMKEARKMLKLAADNGDSHTKYLYAQFLYDSEEDLLEAVEYYKLASVDKIEAMCQLGWMLCYGIGVDANPKEGYDYYRQAAELGDIKAMYNYGMALMNGDVIPINIPKGFKYIKISAKKGIIGSMEKYGKLLYEGDIIPTNKAKAAKYLKIPAERELPEALYYYGLMLFLGDGIPCNASKGIEYIKKAAVQNNSLAIQFLNYFTF